MPKYGVILADPPWSYNQYRDAAHGAAKSAFPCMTQADLSAVNINGWASDTSVLALWATMPKLDHAVDLMRAWGFTHKTGVVWLKNSPKSEDLATGVGIWFQCNAELVLFGVRGKPGNFNSRRGKLGVLEGDRRDPAFWRRVSERALVSPKAKKHSRKPATLQEYLETFPGPYLELFATQERPGWTCLGYDTGYALGPWGARKHDGQVLQEVPETGAPAPDTGDGGTGHVRAVQGEGTQA